MLLNPFQFGRIYSWTMGPLAMMCDYYFVQYKWKVTWVKVTLSVDDWIWGPGMQAMTTNQFTRKPETCTSIQYSANITLSYIWSKCYTKISKIRWRKKMCTSHFNFRPNPIIYPLTVFFSFQAVFTNNHSITVDTILCISFRNSNKELWLYIFGIDVVDLKNQWF